MSIPEPIVNALIAGAAALIAALVAVAIAAIDAWRRRIEQERNVQLADVAVRAVEQTMSIDDEGSAKLSAAKVLAPNATRAMIEAAVLGLKMDDRR